MFIVVRHDITNQKEFFGAAEAVTKGVPQGIKVLQFLPSTEGQEAVCLWEDHPIGSSKVVNAIVRIPYDGGRGALWGLDQAALRSFMKTKPDPIPVAILPLP